LHVAVLITTDRQVVSMFDTELRSSSICLKRFRTSASENRFLAIANHPQNQKHKPKPGLNLEGKEKGLQLT